MFSYVDTAVNTRSMMTHWSHIDFVFFLLKTNMVEAPDYHVALLGDDKNNDGDFIKKD